MSSLPHVLCKHQTWSNQSLTRERERELLSFLFLLRIKPPLLNSLLVCVCVLNLGVRWCHFTIFFKDNSQIVLRVHPIQTWGTHAVSLLFFICYIGYYHLFYKVDVNMLCSSAYEAQSYVHLWGDEGDEFTSAPTHIPLTLGPIALVSGTSPLFCFN